MKFTSRIYKEGIMYLVEIPDEVSAHLETKAYVYVRGSANGVPMDGTFVPRGNGCFKMFMNGQVRKAGKMKVGDEIEFKLQVNERVDELEIPIDLELELAQVPRHSETFNSFTTARKREIIKYIDQAKRAETRLKRIQQMMQYLDSGGKSRNIHE